MKNLEYLGKKRLYILTVLVAFNIVFGALYALYLKNEVATSEKSLNSKVSTVRTMQNQIRTLREEFLSMGNLLKQYKVLEYKGFFNDQDRLEARQTFLEFQQRLRLTKLGLNIESGEVVQESELGAVGYNLVKSDIKIDVEALSDSDVLALIQNLQERFPGEVLVKSITMTKTDDVSRALLSRYLNGQEVSFIEATILAEWLSVAKKGQN